MAVCICPWKDGIAQGAKDGGVHMSMEGRYSTTRVHRDPSTQIAIRCEAGTSCETRPGKRRPLRQS